MSDPDLLSKAIGLPELAPPEWFGDIQASSFWLRIYSCLGIPHADLRDGLQKFFDWHHRLGSTLIPNSRLAIAVGTVNDLKLPSLDWTMVSEESGRTALKIHVDMKPLEQGAYVFLSTPFRVDGIAGNEFEVRTFLNRVSALICLHAGLNFMRHLVFESELMPGNRQLSFPGEAVKMPQATEGPLRQ
jgi:hypothetical protein